MSKNRKPRSTYTVELDFKSGKVEHQVAPGLFQELAGRNFIIKTSQYRAVVAPDYYAYLDHDHNELKFVSRRQIAEGWPARSATARVMELLLLYHYPSLIRSMSEGRYKQHDQVYGQA